MRGENSKLKFKIKTKGGLDEKGFYAIGTDSCNYNFPFDIFSFSCNLIWQG